jgi:hypothetical protein
LRHDFGVKAQDKMSDIFIGYAREDRDKTKLSLIVSTAGLVCLVGQEYPSRPLFRSRGAWGSKMRDGALVEKLRLIRLGQR